MPLDKCQKEKSRGNSPAQSSHHNSTLPVSSPCTQYALFSSTLTYTAFTFPVFLSISSGVIESPGVSITPDEILQKIGEVDAVYIRVDENKAYWVKGEETGSIDLWG